MKTTPKRFPNNLSDGTIVRFRFRLGVLCYASQAAFRSDSQAVFRSSVSHSFAQKAGS